MGQREEYTLVINTVLGSTQGITDAAKAVQSQAAGLAVQGGNAVGQQVGESIQSGLTEVFKKMKQQGGPSKNMKEALGILSTGVSNITGGNIGGLMGQFGAYGKMAETFFGMVKSVAGQVIPTLTMANAGLHGGNGLRGQGVYGTLGGIKDWWTGRGTRESIEDLRLGQMEFYRGQANEQTSGFAERELRGARAAFAPITQANQFERAREERAQLARRISDMRSRADAVGNYAEIQRRAMKEGRFVDLNTGHNITELQAQQQQADAGRHRAMMTDQVEALQFQKRDFEANQYQQRRSTLQGSMQQYASMLPTERWFVRDAFAKAKAGQAVSPSELAAMQSSGIGQEFTQKFMQDKAMREGYSDFARATGDPTYSKAAGMQMTFGGKIEHYLDEKQLADAEQQQVKAATEAGNKLREGIMNSLQKAGIMTNDIQVDRKLITDRTNP